MDALHVCPTVGQARDAYLTACGALQVGDDTMVNDKSSAIVTINSSGIIQMANKVLTQMLG